MKGLAVYLRSIIFGITDSLVSTVGLLAGIDVAGASHRTIALTGIVYAFVEAFSMAVGDFLSEEEAEEFMARRDVPAGIPFLAGTIMFISFVLASFIPLAPYLFLGDPYALPASIVLSVLALFLAGFAGALFARVKPFWRGLRMALLGGAAIVIGVVIGFFVPAA